MNRFVKLDSPLTVSVLASLAQESRTPMISLEPWSLTMGRGDANEPRYSLRAIAAGDFDADFRRIALVLGSFGRPILLRFAHEMNANWYPWAVDANGNSARAYVAAWRHVHRVMAPLAPRALWVWSPVATWWPHPAPLRAMYPGDAFVDIVAASGYGHSGTAEITFGAWYREVQAITKKPAILSEIGADGENRIAWIRSLVPFLEHRPGIVGFVWFSDSPGTTGATGDYRIDQDAATTTAFGHMLRDLDVQCGAES